MLKIEPDHLKALTGLGLVFNEENEYKRSLDYFNQVLKINPTYKSALNGKEISLVGIGQYYLNKNDYESAMGFFEETLKLNELNMDAIHGNVECLILMGL